MNFSRCSWIFSWGSNKILWDDLPPTAYWLWICCYCFIYLNMHWWLKITSMNILNELSMSWKHHWENYFFYCFCSFSLFFKWFKYINQRVLLKFSHFWIFSCRLLRWTLKISKWFLLMSPLSVFWMLSKHQF